MVNCPNNDGGTCGARYAIISARLSDRVIASSMIAKSVEANERRSPFAEPKMPFTRLLRDGLCARAQVENTKDMDPLGDGMMKFIKQTP